MQSCGVLGRYVTCSNRRPETADQRQMRKCCPVMQELAWQQARGRPHCQGLHLHMRAHEVVRVHVPVQDACTRTHRFNVQLQQDSYAPAALSALLTKCYSYLTALPPSSSRDTRIQKARSSSFCSTSSSMPAR